MGKSSIEKAALGFSKLPNIGIKTGMKYALWCISHRNEAAELANSIEELITNVKRCKQCRNVTEEDLCSICKDNSRNKGQLCVVETIESLNAIENSGEYNGLYFVLWDLLSPIQGITSEHIGIEQLVKMIENNPVKEVILVISPNTDGDLTAQYIKETLKNKPLKITRIAYGVPVGMNIGFIDRETLIRAFNGRREF